MSETQNQQSRQDAQHGHQNEPPKRGKNPNDPQNKRPQKQGLNDSKEGQQRQVIGTPHDQNEKQKEHQNR